MNIIKYIFIKKFRKETSQQLSKKIAHSLNKDYEDLELIYNTIFGDLGKAA